MVLAAFFAQQANDNPLSPIVSYLLSFGTLGALFILAMLGHVDLRPAASQKERDDLKALNAALIEAFNQQALPALTASVAALDSTTTELSHLRSEITDLRLQVAQLKGTQ
jgi:hypothetical protein